jgi:MinD-like ATPase involved in chromosome partitioning or flagellar assembly
MPVVCVLSPKGGAGGSMVATNLAVELAKREACLFVDLQPGDGDADLLLGLRPERSWQALLSLASNLPEDQVGRVIEPHPSGVEFLAAPVEPLEEMDVANVGVLLGSLACLCPWLVLDCATRPLGILERALEACSFVLLVTTPDPIALRKTSRLRSRLPIQLEGRCGVVVNRFRGEHRLAAGEIERVLDLPVLAVIPSDLDAADRQTFSGEAVVGLRSGKMSQALAGLAQTIHRAGPALERSNSGKQGPADAQGSNRWPRR